MGVTGLLPLLKSIQRPVELKKFEGLTLGIDAYGWLHRAAYCCADDIAQGKPTRKYINAALHRVRMLRHFGVKPYMVFDGDYLPSKAATEDSRRVKREEKKALAMELLRAGKTAQATQEFQKCIDITPEMASALIQHLKKLGVPCLVAPYEADAQLVYLERKGIVDGIISDDSDLLVFGAKRLLTKLDQYGNCLEINRRDFCACREVSLTGWTDADFRRMAILSGCDYLDGLPGVGLKTAYRMLRKSKTPERVVQMVQLQGKRISENYLIRFYQAELTFLHQWVYCPEKRELVHLTDLDGSRTAAEMPYIGAHVEPELARAIAAGDVDPISKTAIHHALTPNKRRHSQAATAMTAEPPAKPISTYFKGQGRIPMGAMDPNCFSVDPQRISQITHGGLVPRVFPLPRPYLEEASPTRPVSTARRTASLPANTSVSRVHRRRTEPIAGLLNDLSGSTSSNAGEGTPQSSSSGVTTRNDLRARPPKKARLCEELDGQGVSPQKSKFFPTSKAAKSPNRRKTDSFLLSDDSIEEALQSLPDINGWAVVKSPRKEFKVFEAEDVKTTAEEESPTIKEEEVKTEVVKTEEALMPPPPRRQSTNLATVETPRRQTLERFSYSTSTRTPASSYSQHSSIFSTRSTPSTAPSTARSRTTSLQRIGARALNVPPVASETPSDKTRRAKGPPESIPAIDAGGSEDQLVPDSDDEGDEQDEQEPLPRLDLSRFAYA